MKAYPWMLLLLLLAVPAAAERRVLLPTDVEPVVQSGRTLVPVRAVSEAFGAQVRWLGLERAVLVVSDGRQVWLTPGSRQARVDGQAVPIEVAPILTAGRVLVPLRFVGEQLGFPVQYEKQTHSVLLPPLRSGDPTRLLPLPDFRGGIVVHEPAPNAVITSPLQVHGQANVFEGTVVVELLAADGRVLARGVGTGSMGSFHPFTVDLIFVVPPDVEQGRLDLHSPSARDEAERLHPISIPVRFRAPAAPPG